MDAITIYACGDVTWDWPCLHLESSDIVNLDISWRDDSGAAYSLPQLDTGDSVTFYYRPAESSAKASNTGEASASVSDNHVVVSEFDPTALRGIYDGAVRFIDSNNKIRQTLHCILSVTSDRFSENRQRPVVSINDLRMFLYDRMASENRVEGAQEFPDRLLYEGYCAALRQWRENSFYKRVTSQNFPNRNMLMLGAAGWALSSYRVLLARNASRSQGQLSIEADRVQLYSEIGARWSRMYSVWLAEQMRIDDANRSFCLI